MAQDVTGVRLMIDSERLCLSHYNATAPTDAKCYAFLHSTLNSIGVVLLRIRLDTGQRSTFNAHCPTLQDRAHRCITIQRRSGCPLRTGTYAGR